MIQPSLLSRGTLYKVLMDTMLAQNAEITLKNIQLVSINLSHTASQLSVIVNNVNQGKGTLGVMLNDTTLSNELRIAIRKVKEGSEQFSEITNNATEILNQINTGNGVVTGG